MPCMSCKTMSIVVGSPFNDGPSGADPTIQSMTRHGDRLCSLHDLHGQLPLYSPSRIFLEPHWPSLVRSWGQTRSSLLGWAAEHKFSIILPLPGRKLYALLWAKSKNTAPICCVVSSQTWNLSRNLHDQIFGRKNFTHWKCVNQDYFHQQLTAKIHHYQ